uniref:Putative rho n=2 Tax=Nyssomyia neivai TaxID=330878 RepID=A0A1L8E556_9DIPT
MSLFGKVKNIVVVGNGSVGKTSLLMAMTYGAFRESYVATVYDSEEIVMAIDGEEYQVKLHDTAGQEDYERLRRFSYHIADAFVLCYAIPDKVSFDNIELKWIDELHYDKPGVPIILVGTKEDSRTRHCVTREDGEALSKRISAKNFIECSAKTAKNVEEVFEAAVRATIAKNSNKIQGSNWFCWCKKF